jgi:hypothetical protein
MIKEHVMYVIWPLVKIVLVFAIVVVLLRRKANIGLALLIGALVVGVLSRLAPLRLVQIVADGIFDAKTIVLLVMIVLIAVFNDTLQSGKKLERLTRSFGDIIPSKRLGLIFFPSIIALLPMPGGAYFSAPMVREAAKDSGLSAGSQATINYWFRHVWEFSWPLYPTMLWVCQTYDISLSTFIVRMMPFSLIALASGWIVMLRKLEHRGLARIKLAALVQFLRALFPIALLLGLAIGFELVLPAVGARLEIDFPANIGFVFALVISLAWLWIRDKVKIHTIGTMFISRSTLKLALIILGVMVFQTMLIESS